VTEHFGQIALFLGALIVIVGVISWLAKRGVLWFVFFVLVIVAVIVAIVYFVNSSDTTTFWTALALRIASTVVALVILVAICYLWARDSQPTEDIGWLVFWTFLASLVLVLVLWWQPVPVWSIALFTAAPYIGAIIAAVARGRVVGRRLRQAEDAKQERIAAKREAARRTAAEATTTRLQEAERRKQREDARIAASRKSMGRELDRARRITEAVAEMQRRALEQASQEEGLSAELFSSRSREVLGWIVRSSGGRLTGTVRLVDLSLALGLTDAQVLYVLLGLNDNDYVSLSTDSARTTWQEWDVQLKKKGYKAVNMTGDTGPAFRVEKLKIGNFQGVLGAGNEVTDTSFNQYNPHSVQLLVIAQKATELLNALNLQDDDREEVEADVTTLTDLARQPEPDRSRLRIALRRLGRWTSGVVAAGIAGALTSEVNELVTEALGRIS
jgi:hypothetical protein